MAYDVITHGGGEGLVYTFNAVASLFNGSRALGASLVYMASVFSMLLMVMMMVAKQELMPTVKWFFGALFLTSALMVPKVDIVVIDRVTKLTRPVANVPFMLGVFAGISSQLGDILAKQMDAVFSKAGPDYRGNGVAMASQLLSKVNHFHIRDPLMASNVRGFVQQCMVFDIAKGKYTIKALHQTDDIWTLLKENASPARGFVYKTFDEGLQRQGNPSAKPFKSKIITCKEGADALEQAWGNAYKQAAIAYGSRLYPSAPNPANLFMQNLPLAHDYLTQLSRSAESILQQSMMSNAIDDGLLELNQLTDANAAVTAYAAKRAQAQQRVAYSLQGSMASLSLSVLKVVVEILFYGLFPIVVAISIFPGGYAVIKKYLIALFWIQSWAPMYAILNMIMNVYGKASSVAAVHTMGKGALSMTALRGLSEANAWVSSVAGYTMMSVPFLSYGIIHYGAGALSQLSTHFGSVTQSAASHAAEEATTGNYSMGNTTFDTHNRHNLSGFKQDTNASVATGRSTFQQRDGSQLSRNSDGSAAYNRAGSLSEFGGNIKMSDQLATSFNESANQSMQSGMQDSLSAANNLTQAFNQADEFRHHRGKNTDLTQAFSEQEEAYKQTSFSQYKDLITQFSKDNKVDTTTANRWFASIAASAQGSVAGFKLAGSAGYEGSRTSTDSETFHQAEQFAEKNGMAELLQQSMRESKEGRFSLMESDGNSVGQSLSSSLNNASSQIDSAQAHFSKADAYQQQASYFEQNGVNVDQDLSQQYWDSLVKDVGAEQAQNIVSNPDLNYEQMRKFSEAKRGAIRDQFENKIGTTPTAIQQQYNQDKTNILKQDNLNEYFMVDQSRIDERAKRQGLDDPNPSLIKDNVQNKLSEARREISNKSLEVKHQGKRTSHDVKDELGMQDD